MKILKARGFTLIELLFTSAISCFLLLLAIAPFSNFFHQTITKQQTLTLFHSLQFAKIEAIKRHQAVFVCPTHDFVQCHDKKTAGYMIYTHHPKNNLKTILRIEKLGFDSFIQFSRHTVDFSPNGQTHTPSTMTIHSQGFLQKIVISTSGRIRTIS